MKIQIFNSSKRKKLLAQINKEINPKEFVLFEKEKRIYITTLEAARMLSSPFHIKQSGLFLGTMENNRLQLSQSAADVLCRK